MNYLREKIINDGYNLAGLSRRFNIPYRTLQRWLNYENIEQFINFIDFCNYTNINYKNLVIDYKKSRN